MGPSSSSPAFVDAAEKDETGQRAFRSTEGLEPWLDVRRLKRVIALQGHVRDF